MNTDNFIIENYDIELAQNICRMITDSETRNRAVANAIAANIAEKFFDKDSYSVDTESGLHNIGFVLEDIDISDIYINQNYIDVRVFFNEEELSVPEAHYKNNILPTAYMFIKINEDLSGGCVVGFIAPENVNKENLIDGKYYINEEDLQSFYDIEPLLISIDDDVKIKDKDIFEYLDNKLEDKNSFYSNLLQSRNGRLALAKAANAKEIFKFVSVAKDNTIDNLKETSTIENNTDLIQDVSTELDFADVNDLNSIDLLNEDEELSLDLDNAGNVDSFDALDDNTISELETLETDDSIDNLTPINNDEIPELGFETLETEDDIANLPLADNDNIQDLGFELLDSDNSDENEVALDTFDTNTDAEIPDDTIISQREPDNAEFEMPLSFNEQDELNQNFTFAIDDEPTGNINNIRQNEENIEPLSFEDNEIISPAKEEVKTEDFAEDIQDVTETDEAEKESSYDFSTMTTPNIQEDNVLEELSNSSSKDSTDLEENETEDNQIDALFNSENIEPEEISDSYDTKNDDSSVSAKKQKNSIKPVAAIALLIIMGALGYFGYTKYTTGATGENLTNNDIPAGNTQVSENITTTEDAMPIETVEATSPLENTNEGVADTIPAIEQNLDASILVTNLKVDWEVPSGYASNSSAKRYLIKLGKIIQLNLKTELLLLNKPPITNKISVEIKYNSMNKKFETVGIVVSSGEKSVDDVILQTINKALSMNLSMNTDSFAKLQGNPVLVINL